jgi:hypothetical protein
MPLRQGRGRLDLRRPELLARRWADAARGNARQRFRQKTSGVSCVTAHVAVRRRR